MKYRAFGILAAVAVISGCVLTGPTYVWNKFTPTGQVYEYEGKKYDVYQGFAYAEFQGETLDRKGKVLFPAGTGPRSLRTGNIKAVCWDGDSDPCDISFGKQLRASSGAERDEGGMDY